MWCSLEVSTSLSTVSKKAVPPSYAQKLHKLGNVVRYDLLEILEILCLINLGIFSLTNNIITPIINPAIILEYTTV